MALPDEKKKVLEDLGFKSFDEISLRQLFDAIAKHLPLDTGKKRNLNIYVVWLHSRLMAIDVSAENDFTEEIGSWYRFLKVLSHDDCLIIDAFHDWQRKQAIDDPASSRRLSIAEAELRKLMDTWPTGPAPVPKPAPAGASFGQMHPDRVKLSRESRTVIEISDDDDDDDGDVVVLSSNPVRKHGNGKQGQPGLPFLTGSNMMPLKERTKTAADKKKADKPGAPSKPIPLSSGPRAPGQKGTEVAVSKQLSEGFTCDRCGKTGHTPKKCPTNMDPSWDRTPPKSYKCDFCGKLGDHFGPLCPNHPDPFSIGRLRQRKKKGHVKAGAVQPTEPKDGHRNEREPRVRDDRRSRIDDLLRGKDRSRSAPRDGRRRRDGRDTYNPADGSAHSQLARYRTKRVKRKASRSPSPGEIVPRKTIDSRDRSPSRMLWLAPTRRRLKFPDGLMNERATEGRLSYDDVIDEDVTSTSPVEQAIRSPSVEKMDVDRAESPVSEGQASSVLATEDLSLELEVLEMIRAESVKTDLLLLVNGVEHVPIAASALIRLFGKQKNIRVNDAFNKERLCATDFFIFHAEEELMDCRLEVESEVDSEVDWEEDQTDLRAKEWTEAASPTAGDDGDQKMADVQFDLPVADADDGISPIPSAAPEVVTVEMSRLSFSQPVEETATEAGEFDMAAAESPVASGEAESSSQETVVAPATTW